MKFLVPVALIGTLAGCEVMNPTTTPTTNVTDLPLMGGYRSPADVCEKLGENELTVNYLDHTADLVGCPADYEGRGVFVTDTGATEITQIDDWVIYSVSRE